jgi:hypothetical protein
MKLSSPVFLKDLKITRLFVLHNDKITHTRAAISYLLSLVCLTAPYTIHAMHHEVFSRWTDEQRTKESKISLTVEIKEREIRWPAAALCDMMWFD